MKTIRGNNAENATIIAQMFADEISQARKKVALNTAQEILDDVSRELDR